MALTVRAGALLVASIAAAAQTAARATTPQAARAAFERGVALDVGQTTVPDPVRARRDYEIAARAGMPEAEFNLAVMFDSGIGTTVDKRSAALWYARAAAHDVPRAAYDLAQLFSAGNGVPRNQALASDWFAVAAKEGVSAARLRAELEDQPGSSTLSAPQPEPVQIDVAAPGAPIPIELAWTATAMPNDARFFVEVASVDTRGMRDLVWRGVPCSAALVGLPSTPGHYAWRVFIASASVGHYLSSAWTEFAVGYSGGA